MVLLYNNYKWPYQYYGCLFIFFLTYFKQYIFFNHTYKVYIISIIIADDKQKQYNDRACCAVFFCLYCIDMQFSACYSGKATLYMAAYIIELTKRNFRCSLHCISFHVLFWKKLLMQNLFPTCFRNLSFLSWYQT